MKTLFNEVSTWRGSIRSVKEYATGRLPPTTQARQHQVGMHMFLEYVMGVGLQVAFLGFPRSFVLEAEANAQLVRLERFGRKILGCNLTIQAFPPSLEHRLYGVQLDVITLSGALIPMPSCANDDPLRAVEAAFDAAESEISGEWPVLPYQAWRRLGA
jgi:hypothetical protein